MAAHPLAGQGAHGVSGQVEPPSEPRPAASSLPAFEQDASNGYHRKLGREGLYCGWCRAGQRHGLGSLRWADGAEYHGDFSGGEPHGTGKYVFADGSVYTGQFEHGRPAGPGFLVDRLGVRYKAGFDGGRKMREQTEPLEQTEEPHEPYTFGRAYCVALTIGPPREVSKDVYQGNFPNIKDVSGRLVLARPPHGDVALWNAEEVRGKLVAIMRGPRPPAPAVNYGIKMFHAQNAGAIGVVFVDYDPEGGFTSMPRIDELVIPGTEPPQSLKARIPCCFIRYRDLAVIQEGAFHQMVFAPPDHPHNKRGWRTGMLCCPPQESKVGLSKSKADALMAEFFSARKEERKEEAQILVQNVTRTEAEKEKELLSKEWVTGALFDSLNPLKQVKETEGTDSKVALSMVRKMEKLAGQENVKWVKTLFGQNSEPSAQNPNGAPTSNAPPNAQNASPNGQQQQQQQPPQGAPLPPPLPPPPPQDTGNGYHVVVEEGMVMCGFVEEGLPHGMCSLRWADGSEFHGRMERGGVEQGRFIFPDKAEYRGAFRDGLPQQGFYLDPTGVRHRVQYDGTRALWEAGCVPGVLEEEPPAPFTEGRAESVAMTVCEQNLKADGKADGSVQVVPDYSHIRDVTARLVWARPPYADVPLWNAEEVQGKIVAIVRGPRAPAPACSYSKKVYHAQQAGAVAVVLVDFDPRGKFGVLPRLEQGPLCNYPRETIKDKSAVLRVRVPTAFVLHRHGHVLQEGAVHHMVFAPAGHQAAPAGWRIGFILCPRQESKVGLSKSKADALMAEFFSARKEERKEEVTLLKEKKAKKEVAGESPEELTGREWVSGHLFDSLNPLKQEASKQSSMTAAMLSQITSKQRAEEISESLDRSAAMMQGLVQGALATMTGEAMHSNVLSGFAASPSHPAPAPSLDATTPAATPRSEEGEVRVAVEHGKEYGGKRDMGVQVDPPSPPLSPRNSSKSPRLATGMFSTFFTPSPSPRRAQSPRRT